MALAILVGAGGLAAHEEGVLRLGTPTGSPGAEIEIRGERLPPSASVRLELRGALASRPLTEVATDERGSFTLRLLVPTGTAPGRYRVVAVAEDGDDVARVDLIVLAVPQSELAPAGPFQPVHATADEMELERRLTAGEWAAIAAFVLACAAAGAALLRSSESRSTTGPRSG